ncbi:MAG: TIM-barrel domain-containing protein [Promethearchaeota archaeon]
MIKGLNDIKNECIADPKAIIKKDKIRFTVLTSRIIRMEYSESNSFIDNPSQLFWYRKQLVPDFEVIESDGYLELITEHLHLKYKIDNKGFTKLRLFIEIKESGIIWHYGDKDYKNLKGTARTLDMADGKIPLENGLMSRSGWSLIDDSKSLVFNNNGWLIERKEKEKDMYFFGYGNDYEQCLKDYCKIAGAIPLLPRWSLGNWWSRYWEYTQEELADLMNEFEEREVPLSVCIIDMDWHIVKINEYLKKHSKEDWSNIKFHNGWTGFTWNEDLFPDYKGFLKFLRQKRIKSALNLHPSDGIYPHEKQYERIAQFMGVDPKSKKPIKFDITNPKFCEAYFKFIYHPYEEDGVDFWWMDWQQESTSNIKGLDPLWWLNHLNFYDLGRDRKKRPFIFSRWGGLGNHRYQIGFSGDTFSTWNSLSFLPYFTSTASNVGYTWWSHDLGGHMGGFGLDSELYVRWIQFGLFSPIFRLHCTKNPYNERLPWCFDNEVFKIAKEVMQLRHLLIPYIYTMAWKTHEESIPLIRPMYYLHPKVENAYNALNQYYFGTELMCSPFISKIDDDVGQSRQEVWMPEGVWFNFFTGEYYEGGKIYVIYGKLDEIPVFAKAGAIIPLARHPKIKSKWNDTSNPACLDVIVFPGKNNIFKLYEDDGETQDFLKGKYAITEFNLKQSEKELHIKVNKVLINESFIWMPKERTYNFIFKGIKKPNKIKVQINNKFVEVKSEFDVYEQKLAIIGIKITPKDEIDIFLTKKSSGFVSKRNRTLENCKKLLRYMKINSRLKMYIDSKLSKVIKDSKMFGKIFSSIIKSIDSTDVIAPSQEVEILKKTIPTIKIGTILENILPDFKNGTLKDQLFEIDLKDKDKATITFKNMIQHSYIVKLLFSLKESQIKALIETSGGIFN